MLQPNVYHFLFYHQDTNLNATFNIIHRNIDDLPPLTKDPITRITYFSIRNIYIPVSNIGLPKTMVESRL